VVGGDRGEAVRGEGKGVADWRGQPVSGARARARARVGRLAGGVGLSVGVIAHAEWAGGGPRGGSRECEERVAAGVGRESAQPRGKKGFSFFYSQFLFSVSIFISFSFEQLII
jgi:hypothetical protein